APFTTGNLNVGATGTVALNLNANAPAAFSSLNVNGAATLTAGATLNLTANPGVGVPAGNKIVLINNDSNDAIAGTFTGLTSPVTLNGVPYTVSYTGGSSNDLDLTAANVAPIVASGALALPNPAFVGQTANFIVA